MSLAGQLAVKGVWFYRTLLRPLRAGGGATCRFTPSCSEYALGAFQTWGLFRGAWLTLKRIGRCQPWGGVGDDPVPERPQPHQPRSPHVCL